LVDGIVFYDIDLDGQVFRIGRQKAEKV
jgi:hypothetical protein